MGKKIIQGTLEVTDAGTTDNSVVVKKELNTRIDETKSYVDAKVGSGSGGTKLYKHTITFSSIVIFFNPITRYIN